MLTQDASAVLPREERFWLEDYMIDAQARWAEPFVAPFRDRQHADLTTARAKVKPKGDRMKIHEGA